MLFSPKPMHIPDGFLGFPVSLLFWFISIVVIGIALRKTSKQLGEREIPLMGVLAAAIFAGQMLNFSVTGGTSGHLLGAALATILMGPWAAVLIMTSVVSVQAILFQDGGIIALGSNLFNMAVVGVFVSSAVFSLVKKLFKNERTGLFIGGGLAAWTSIFIASLSCALQLALSGTSPANLAVPAMGAIHALIGIGEAVITVGALSFIYAARKDLLKPDIAQEGQSKSVLIGGGLLTLILIVLSPLASSHPDGLEWVAEQKGFLENARGSLYSLIPDYVMPGISNEAVATIIAATIGAAIVFVIGFGVARAQKKSAQ
ncbi:MAG: cobalt/nickel transport system permease protein [Chloroflexi bacterium]|nr:MAG: cobalt/nickel transport system permease protein [Chloroflexota bacterium]